MAKAVKLRNELYLDTRGIVHKGKILADILYPVGSVYITMKIKENPSTLFGGTWVQIKDCFLWATDGITTGTVGGSRTTDGHTLTVDEMPSHCHNYKYNVGNGGYASAEVINAGTTAGYAQGSSAGGAWYCWTEYRGGGQAHSHTYMPPYFEVYMWYRTA